ncbi:MAG: large conductance mechanosensitive channel protein MscL [Oscillospiraceae bacterium]|jgi:large conductance mechanosensitive channel|nr:large conductance mechanosensitive channel protein MscL [Oscillospiraceae bacterium]
MSKKKKSLALANKGKGFLAEFKAFALKGNMIDLAVAVIVGGAFQVIVNSLVKDIVMPLIGRVTGGVDFSNQFVVLGSVPDGADISTLDAARKVVSVFAYGSFITAVIHFLIMAFVIFMLVKFLNRLKKVGVKKEGKTPDEKDCPFCKKAIAMDAIRCPFCTSDLSEEK